MIIIKKQNRLNNQENFILYWKERLNFIQMIFNLRKLQDNILANCKF